MRDYTEEFTRWELAASDVERLEPLWRMSAYRLGRFLGDRAWADADVIRRRPLGYPVADQLVRAAYSIPANLAEGYSRSSGRDRVRLFEYALGSTRESIVWYSAGAHVLPPALVESRLATLVSVRSLLLAAIPRERRRTIDATNRQ